MWAYHEILRSGTHVTILDSSVRKANNYALERLKTIVPEKKYHHLMSWNCSKWSFKVLLCFSLLTFDSVNTLKPGQNGRHFTDDILRCIFLNGDGWISIEINDIPAIVQIMVWRRPGASPLSEPTIVRHLWGHSGVVRLCCKYYNPLFLLRNLYIS